MKKLIIYQKALKLVTDIYNLIKTNDYLARDFSLSDQLKRASVSVATNISEGYCRTKKQFKNYLSIASGSANEVVTLLEIVELVYKSDTKSLKEEYDYLAKQISAFSKKIN